MRVIAAVACAIAFAAACDGGPAGPTGPAVDVPGPTVDAPGPTVDAPGPTVDVPGPTVDMPRPTGDVRVSGRVLDFGTSAGAPNVTVSLGNSTTVTGANGSYRMTVPSIGPFVAVADGRDVGRVRVNGPDYRGDLFVNWGLCIGRYGTVTDARTLRPIAGASVTVAGRRVVTEIDGWYSVFDVGCPTSPFPGIIIGSTGQGAIRVSHPQYVGIVVNAPARSLEAVFRYDFELQPQ